jgi:general stress protein 26
MSPGPDTVDILRDLFARQRLGVLATQGQGHPYASLVAVRASDDLRHLYFTTTRATRKFHFLSADPHAAMLVDSRSDDDLAFLERHPHLRTFASAPTSALVDLTVDTYYVVSRFQNVTELHME